MQRGQAAARRVSWLQLWYMIVELLPSVELMSRLTMTVRRSRWLLTSIRRSEEQKKMEEHSSLDNQDSDLCSGRHQSRK
jgi:hypothetical protein